MASTFPGFPKEGIAFLRDLKKHNDREWFNPRKQIFEENVRQPMTELAAALHGRMLQFAPDYVGEPAACVYRIYRDTRFSKDKTPYKTYASALFLRNGFSRHEGSAAYYFAVSPENIEVAGGVYTPDRDVLLAVRHHIADDHKRFRSTFETARVRKLFGGLSGESLTRIPKGFPRNHPAIDLVKRKQYLLDAKLDPELATTPKLLRELARYLEAMTPFIEFLNRPLLKLRERENRDKRFLK